MKVLVIGKGGREHAIVWKLAQSPRVDKIYAAPGSDGMIPIAEAVNISENDFDRLIAFAHSESIDLTIVGPEQPLVDGIVDRFEAEGLKIFGPSKEAAIIEGSKKFAKQLMKDYGIPTGDYQIFNHLQEAVDYIKKVGAPIVIKADGLAAGKGVVVAMTEEEAIEAVNAMMVDQQFGSAGATVVIEEFLTGEEYSLMAFVDGTRIYPMVLAQDHKRAFDGDKGPNTGGMGAYSPVPQLPENVLEESMQQVLEPVARALFSEARPYRGVLYAGLMWTDIGPKVIEFNCRFGDPETQVVLPRLRSDLFDVMWSIVNGEVPALEWSEEAVCGVVLASKGYPGDYKKGAVISGLDDLDNDTLLFHAGTKKEDRGWTTNGGRVLLVARKAADLITAIAVAESEIEKLAGPDVFFRRDIGHRAISELRRG
ncbi:MAG: phosphoribosylamine--glycine ligase [Tuberibacillus sp.]